VTALDRGTTRLDPEQLAFLNVVFEPFNTDGEWPVWAYVDPPAAAVLMCRKSRSTYLRFL
jgi:hypothetical protein